MPFFRREKSCYQMVTISLSTTVLETIEKALEKFGINVSFYWEMAAFL